MRGNSHVRCGGGEKSDTESLFLQTRTRQIYLYLSSVYSVEHAKFSVFRGCLICLFF